MIYPILADLAQVAAGFALATIVAFTARALLLAIDDRLQARRASRDR